MQKGNSVDSDETGEGADGEAYAPFQNRLEKYIVNWESILGDKYDKIKDIYDQIKEKIKQFS